MFDFSWRKLIYLAVAAFALFLLFSQKRISGEDGFITLLIAVFTLLFTAVVAMTIFQYTSTDNKMKEFKEKLDSYKLYLEQTNQFAETVKASYKEIGSLYALQTNIVGDIAQLLQDTQNLYNKSNFNSIYVKRDIENRINLAKENQIIYLRQYFKNIISNKSWDDKDVSKLTKNFVELMGQRIDDMKPSDIFNLRMIENNCYTINNETKQKIDDVVNLFNSRNN